VTTAFTKILASSKASSWAAANSGVPKKITEGFVGFVFIEAKLNYSFSKHDYPVKCYAVPTRQLAYINRAY
jgi:hypothetical protein